MVVPFRFGTRRSSPKQRRPPGKRAGRWSKDEAHLPADAVVKLRGQPISCGKNLFPGQAVQQTAELHPQFFFAVRFFTAQQPIRGHLKIGGQCRKQLNIRAADAGFPFGYRLIGDAQGGGQLLLGDPFSRRRDAIC